MRVQILSDLHIEFPGNTIPSLAPDAELIILAGDLAPVHTRRVEDIARRWAGADRVLYVPGNHEFYGSEIDIARHELARQCLKHGVTLLDPGAITVDHVRFIGATLWTDFLLDGVAGEAWAHLEVGSALSDFTGAIRHNGNAEGRFTTKESARRHAEHREFIETELEKAEASELTPVVITHHAPSPHCIRPWFKGSRLNPGFASDLDSIIARYQPPLWVAAGAEWLERRWSGSPVRGGAEPRRNRCAARTRAGGSGNGAVVNGHATVWKASLMLPAPSTART